MESIIFLRTLRVVYMFANHVSINQLGERVRPQRASLMCCLHCLQDRMGPISCQLSSIWRGAVVFCVPKERSLHNWALCEARGEEEDEI